MGLTLSNYAVAGLAGCLAGIIALLAALFWRPAARPAHPPMAWKSYRIGYPVYALIFLSFDMEMIFMYPWAVVYAGLGLKALLDMLVFIAILSAGIAYTWGMGGFQWE